jgi:hypothetical protein
MTTMSKSAALKVATNAVGKPIGRGTSWLFYAPYYADKVDGPSTEYRASSYAMALTRRTQCVVDVALAQMGIKGSAYLDGETGSAKDLLDLVLSDQARYIVK